MGTSLQRNPTSFRSFAECGARNFTRNEGNNTMATLYCQQFGDGLGIWLAPSPAGPPLSTLHRSNGMDLGRSSLPLANLIQL